MIDNFSQIQSLLKFDNEHEFYFLQIIQRKKDHKNNELTNGLGTSNNSRLIKAYYIYSVEQLQKYKNEIVQLCTLFNARAGISLNRRNAKAISLEMMCLLATNIKNNHFEQLGRLYNTICGQHHSEADKTWLLDIDSKNMDLINEIRHFINYELEPNKLKDLALIETKNGYHLITTGFNSQKFGVKFPDIEIHKNNPTILYIP